MKINYHFITLLIASTLLLACELSAVKDSDRFGQECPGATNLNNWGTCNSDEICDSTLNLCVPQIAECRDHGECPTYNPFCDPDSHKCSCYGKTCGESDTCCNNHSNPCVNTKTDTKNCGFCGRECKTTQKCEEGKCIDISCQNGVKCGFSVCVNLATSKLQDCENCMEGWGDCDGDLAENGCETSTKNDPNNCGGCGIICKTGTSCFEGECKTQCSENQLACDDGTKIVCLNQETHKISSCDTCQNGYGDCLNGFFSDGCETNLMGDSSHCKSCGNKCPDGLVCSQGTCSKNCATNETPCPEGCLNLSSLNMLTCNSCAQGYGNCDDNWTTGCEVNLAQQNMTSCGTCTSSYCYVGSVCVLNTSPSACGNTCTPCTTPANGDVACLGKV